ncbi:hypothetical protein [Nannocystis radixulma]|uniref:Lipoprotein n=1 Tax=Nannocystis radixulma TaxID=2995305 RepID=A0ABT5B6E1_9BACT|nr:hypothetical protein [Nannocystis radixulma]MDC0668647.1 hypothetical protein [Nannocystis radixulma]
MRLSYRCLLALVAISLLPACPIKGGGDPTDGDSTDTTEGDLPAECEQSDPAVSAAVEFVIEGWPVLTSDDFEFDVLCEVDGVATAAGTVSTDLTCDVDGSSLPAILRMPEAPEGSVAWATGESVRLIAHSSNDVDYGGLERHIQLRAADDDALLAASVQRGADHIDPASIIAPLTFAFEYLCGPLSIEGDSGVISLRLTLGIPNGATTSIFSRHRGQLPIDAAQAYAIDVEEASGNHCCHFSEDFHFLVRRVLTGG